MEYVETVMVLIFIDTYFLLHLLCQSLQNCKEYCQTSSPSYIYIAYSFLMSYSTY